MKRGTASKRQGTTRTVSISIDAETRSLLKKFAAEHFEGNVSALVVALARELQRKESLDWLIARAGVPRATDAELQAMVDEIDSASAASKPPRRAA